MLKVEAGRPLPAIVIGTSSDLMVGEEVITIGNAFGYENTVSVGIISALKRNVTLSDDQVYRNLIQTDAAINPGNSGGPLINIDGELVGINVAVRAGAQGIGFALPIDDVKRVAAEMMSTRRLSAAWHGLVAGETRNGPIRAVVLSDVQAGSPAEAAGFKPGDQLIQVNDLRVLTALDIERGFLDLPPGKPAKVTIRRSGKDQALALELKPLPRMAADADEQVWRMLGLKTSPVTPEYVVAASPKLRGGLYVQAVSPGSAAARALIQKGDILVGMNVGDAALGDHPPRQHPLHPPPTRAVASPDAPVLHRPPERHPPGRAQGGRRPQSACPQPLSRLLPHPSAITPDPPSRRDHPTELPPRPRGRTAPRPRGWPASGGFGPSSDMLRAWRFRPLDAVEWDVRPADDSVGVAPPGEGRVMLRIRYSAMRRGLLGLVVLSVSAAPASLGAATLRWKFKPGETLRYSMEQKTVTTLKVPGQLFHRIPQRFAGFELPAQGRGPPGGPGPRRPRAPTTPSRTRRIAEHRILNITLPSPWRSNTTRASAGRSSILDRVPAVGEESRP